MLPLQRLHIQGALCVVTMYKLWSWPCCHGPLGQPAWVATFAASPGRVGRENPSSAHRPSNGRGPRRAASCLAHLGPDLSEGSGGKRWTGGEPEGEGAGRSESAAQYSRARTAELGAASIPRRGGAHSAPSSGLGSKRYRKRLSGRARVPIVRVLGGQRARRDTPASCGWSGRDGLPEKIRRRRLGWPCR